MIRRSLFKSFYSWVGWSESSQSLTGATVIFFPHLSNDLRLNYSQASTNRSFFVDNIGGAVVDLPPSHLYAVDLPGASLGLTGHSAQSGPMAGNLL